MGDYVRYGAPHRLVNTLRVRLFAGGPGGLPYGPQPPVSGLRAPARHRGASMRRNSAPAKRLRVLPPGGGSRETTTLVGGPGGLGPPAGALRGRSPRMGGSGKAVGFGARGACPPFRANIQAMSER